VTPWIRSSRREFSKRGCRGGNETWPGYLYGHRVENSLAKRPQEWLEGDGNPARSEKGVGDKERRVQVSNSIKYKKGGERACFGLKKKNDDRASGEGF